MKTKINIWIKPGIRLLLVVAGLFVINMLYAQGAHPGADPDGMSVPVDGGILMALLAGGGVLAMMLKKKKKED